jgi:type II secretory pathway pseudopilin PulG
MNLRGQSENGYAMAVLLVAMGIMAVMLTALMPVWNQAARREKEAELVFRGQQYARAIGMFQRKYANTPPPSIDVLVQEKFLRKKYKDPITNTDFVPLPAAGGGVLPGTAPGATASNPTGRGGPDPTGRGGPAPAGRGAPIPTGRGAPANQPARAGQPISPFGAPTGGVGGGIIGVTSSSKAESIRVYNGATHYNEWRFVYAPTTATPGGGVPGAATPGGGAAGTPIPGQRGQPPARRGFPGGGFPGPAGSPNPTTPTRGGPGGRSVFPPPGPSPAPAPGTQRP